MTETQAVILLFSLFQGVGLMVLNSFKADLREIKEEFRNISKDFRTHLADHAKGAFSD